MAVALAATLSHAQTWTDLDRHVQGKKADVASQILLDSPKVFDDETLSDLEGKELVEAVHVRARMERAAGESDAAAATKIKGSFGIVDGRTAGEANWLRDALNRLKNLFSRRAEPPDLSNINPGAAATWGVYAMWAVLGAAVACFLYFALRHLSKLKRRAVVKALVEEDEPERTLDEWLQQANDLEAQGRHREAVRALYLACLIRLDEAGVARFIRHETNWEHQHRIEASPKRPPGLEIRPATQLMDRVWYGKRTQGAPDVARMREAYNEVLRAVAGGTP